MIDKSDPTDAITVEAKIADLRSRWDDVCGISVDRQRQLEEALLFHGMFHDAVQALIDWLNTIEPGLSNETAVMGDVDTVKLLIDHHKHFQRDLGSRQRNYDKIIKSGDAMIKEGRVDDAETLEQQLDDLRVRWEAVCTMSVTKQVSIQNVSFLTW